MTGACVQWRVSREVHVGGGGGGGGGGTNSLASAQLYMYILKGRAGFRQLWALGNYTWWGPP